MKVHALYTHGAQFMVHFTHMHVQVFTWLLAGAWPGSRISLCPGLIPASVSVWDSYNGGPIPVTSSSSQRRHSPITKFTQLFL